MAGWRWVAASRRGTSHARTGSRRQDALSCFTSRAGAYLVSLVADGAGTAVRGGEGAAIACRTFGTALRAHLASSDTMPSDEMLWSSLDTVRDRIGIAARRLGLSPRDFAATMVAMVTDGERTIVVHVGDGAATARLGGTATWIALSWPEQGDYASTTFFVTDDPVPRFRIGRFDRPVDALAVFTDGVERLALDFAGREPHQPFFRSMIAAVERGAGRGRDGALSAALGDWLDGPVVCGRTDDDKTLVLAVRT